MVWTYVFLTSEEVEFLYLYHRTRLYKPRYTSLPWMTDK